MLLNIQYTKALITGLNAISNEIHITLPIKAATTIQYPKTPANGPVIPLCCKKFNNVSPTPVEDKPVVCLVFHITYAKLPILTLAKKADTIPTLFCNTEDVRALPKKGRTIHIILAIIICIFVKKNLRTYL
jgi:hypothetical protein